MIRPAFFLLVLLAAAPASAQQARRPTASDRFHQAARLYVGGDSTGATRAAQAGLQLAPNDPRLRALMAEIQRRPPPQPPQGGGGEPPPQQPPPQDGNQGQNRQPQQPRQQPPQQPPQGQGQNRDRQPQQPRPEGQQPRPQQPRQQPPRQPQQGQGQPAQPQPGDQPPTGTAAARPNQMTRAEAEALLRALGADERRLLRARPAATSPAYVEKDW